MQRKGVCMNHFRDVQQFFKGAHVVLHAQTEEEVESEVLMSHVMKMSNRIKIDKNTSQSSNDNDKQAKPVGTNYQRVNAQSELSQADRETFWEKQKKEDEAQRKVLRQKEAENRASRTNVDNSSVRNNNEKPTVPNKSVELRQARMDEAKQLIGKRSISSAKAFFENANSVPKAPQTRKEPIKIDREAPNPKNDDKIEVNAVTNDIPKEIPKEVPKENSIVKEIPKEILQNIPEKIDNKIPVNNVNNSSVTPNIPSIIEPINGNGHLNGLTKVPEEEENEDEVDDVAEREYEDSEIIVNNEGESSGEEMCPQGNDFMNDFVGRNSYYDAYRPLENIQEGKFFI